VVSPVVAPVQARIEPARLPESHGPAFGNLLSWNGGRVSIVGTLALSVLIGTGLFSLQMISKWRRPAKPAQAEAKAPGLDQPLLIADAPNEAAPFDESADSAAASQAHTALLPADAEDAAHHGRNGVSTVANSNDASDNLSTGETKASRAPYAPDPIDLSNASGTVASDRTVAAPEVDGEHGSLLGSQPTAPLNGQPLSGQPATPPSGHANRDQNTAANGNAMPGPPQDLADRPAEVTSGKSPEAGPSSKVYGLFDRSGAALKTAERISQDTAEASPPSQGQALANAKNVNLVEWNRSVPNAAPAAPASATQIPNLADAARSSLDAPGPVILPGRPAASNSAVSNSAASNSPAANSGAATSATANYPAAGALPGVVPASGTSSGTGDALQADASPQLRDLTQRPPTETAGAPTGAAQPTSGVDPVSGLFDHRPTAAPDAAHSDTANGLAALDRTKVMSFQFRNAPWTVVLAQFATDTHLELRMQTVPQGVFNRWDSARYSPSQTLAILNSELSRTGCQLKLEGSVLRVCPRSTATAAAAPVRPAAAAPAGWLPQSSGIVPVSGRY
jgi:hypothetical protein